MLNYVTLSDNSAVVTVKKSRFIGFIYHIKDEEDAALKIKDLRKKYYDCSHIVYAYSAGENAEICRFSDDGEPQGSGGMPLLKLIQESGFRKVLFASVRYFGGIKLGVGGLSRAYTDCLKEALKNCKRKEYTLCDFYNLTLDYSVFNKKGEKLNNENIKTTNIIYGDTVTLTIKTKHQNDIGGIIENIIKGVTDALKFIETKYSEN